MATHKIAITQSQYAHRISHNGNGVHSPERDKSGERTSVQSPLFRSSPDLDRLRQTPFCQRKYYCDRCRYKEECER